MDQAKRLDKHERFTINNKERKSIVKTVRELVKDSDINTELAINSLIVESICHLAKIIEENS